MADKPITRISLAAVLLWPLAVSAGVWIVTGHHAQEGQQWLIPVHGYDPRDLLRGHYVRYRYDWPVGSPDSASPGFDPARTDRLCIEGSAPIVERVRPVSHTGTPCATIVRAAQGTRREVQGLGSGIVFVAQNRESQISGALNDRTRQAYIRANIRRDGIIQPVALEFRKRRVR